MIRRRFLSLLIAGLLLAGAARAESFRVLPYVQNPSQDAMTVRWLSDAQEPGVLTVQTAEGPKEFRSQPKLARELAYNPFKPEPGGPYPGLPWLHSIRVTGLKAGTRYAYEVRQEGQTYKNAFRTAPAADQPIRFVAFSDMETEPESTTKPPVDWPPCTHSNRPAGIKRYLADQTTGYRENLKVIASRRPDFILIPGDLAESGGAQRDWDEFWRHVAGRYGTLAGSVPIVPTLGNHENFAGPGGGYTAEGADFSTDKFLTYFEAPSNQAANPKHRGRYYRVDYGPLTLIVIDSSNGLPHKTASDTNHYLEGSNAPDFNPGSEQYRWLEKQLADAQRKSVFTVVSFHHTMYGSGPHSIPFGQPGFSGQSGIAMRVIRPLLLRYGVAAAICGHDEVMERAMVTGEKTLPDGSTRAHSVHFYDVGFAGDGLRGPVVGFDNPYRKFIVHEDVPEVWKGKQLVSGGKHYGHLEVNITRTPGGQWQAVFTPAYAFPITDSDGKITGWERRVYDDVVTITAPPVSAK